MTDKAPQEQGQVVERPVHEDPYPSREAMEAAIELEVHACLGRVQTQTVGKVIQRAINKAIHALASPVNQQTHITIEDHQEKIEAIRAEYLKHSLGAEAEIQRLNAVNQQMLEALKAYERWEADVILCNECWPGTLPRITQELWYRLIEIQTMRNAALAAAEAKEAMPSADRHKEAKI